jgi:agmatinase
MDANDQKRPDVGDPCTPDDGFLGCQVGRGDARVVLIPVPFDATCSSRPGAAHGPAAIVDSSVFLDAEDRIFGDFADIGVHMEVPADWIGPLSADTRLLVEPLLDSGAGDEDRDRVAAIDAACDRVRAHVRGRVAATIRDGKLPGVIGGEHGVSEGAIAAVAEAHGSIGVLQIDAHLDLRDAYLGLRHSHASVMRNAINLPGVDRLVSVGIRDWSAAEWAFAVGSGRVRAHFADDLNRALLEGEAWSRVCDRVVADLPEVVYVTFDIDGLEVGLCPNTGTPVPGGLSYHQATVLLERLGDSGRRIAGFDLVEVSPPPGASARERTVDGVVGARVLQRLIGCAARSVPLGGG